MIGVKPIFDFGGFPGGHSVFKRGKFSKLDALTYRDIGHPSLLFFSEMDANMTAGVVLWSSLVFAIFKVWNNPKIANAIICAIAVDVVNLFVRRRAVVHRPDNSMRHQIL